MKILQLILAILGTLLLPLVLLCLAPFFAYRWLVGIIYPMVSREILKIVPPSSSIYATLNKEFHTTGNLLITINFEDTIVYEELLKAVSERMIEVKGTRGRKLYPELTHHIVRRYGYFFWKKDTNFSIKDHVQLLTEPLNFGLKKAFLDEFFDPEKSPWKMLLVGSRKKILFKFHHSLGDGYSLLNVLMSCADENLVKNQPKSTKTPLWKTLFFPILALYEILTYNGSSEFPWDQTVDETTHTRIFSTPRSLSKGIITERAKILNASFTATIFGVMAVGIQRILKQQNGSIRTSNMDACVPLRLYSRHKSLKNKFGTAYLKIPITLSLKETVKAIDENIRIAKNSTCPQIVKIVCHLTDLLGCQKILWTLPTIRVLFTPIQGPRNPLYLNGVPVSGFYFQMNTIGKTPLSLYSITYQGNLQYVLGGYNNILTEQMIEDLSDFIYQEISRPESNYEASVTVR